MSDKINPLDSKKIDQVAVLKQEGYSTTDIMPALQIEEPFCTSMLKLLRDSKETASDKYMTKHNVLYNKKNN